MILEMKEAKRLFSNSLIVFVGTMSASVFSYVYNMLMGRMLGPSQYGEMTAIMSLIAVIGVGGGAITTIAMRYSSELYCQEHFSALRKLRDVLIRYIFIGSITLFVIGISFSKIIQNFLQISSSLPIIIAFLELVSASHGLPSS
jgi:O-antigen/teichoic acid export membrane protein